MSGHTPGPWVFKRGRFNKPEDDHCGSLGSILGRDEWFITEVWGDVDECEANAHLIAAAPDMLAALDLVDLHFQRNQVSGNFQGDDEHEAWRAVTKAIRKAYGR